MNRDFFLVFGVETTNQLLQCFSSIIIPAVCWTSPAHREFEPCIYTCLYSSTLLCHDPKVVVSAVETVGRQWSCAEDGDGIHHYLGGVRSRRQFRQTPTLSCRNTRLHLPSLIWVDHVEYLNPELWKVSS